MPTTVPSFSKINLGLAIGPGRADGFHSLTTCYQTLAAHDLVTVEAAPAAQTALEIRCSDPRVPCDATNTAWKIADLALRSLGVPAQVHIHIEKRLPVQGGLGAGSANAVAALLALEAELGRHGIEPLTGPEKLRIAALVGSDVPLFLIGGAVLGVGRGEEVYPLPDLPPTECVLALPDVGVSTPQAFRDWDGLQSTELRAQSSAGVTGPAATDPGRTAAFTGERPSDKLVPLSRALASAFVAGPIAAAHSSGVSASGGDQYESPLLALVRTGRLPCSSLSRNNQAHFGGLRHTGGDLRGALRLRIGAVRPVRNRGSRGGCGSEAHGIRHSLAADPNPPPRRILEGSWDRVVSSVSGQHWDCRFCIRARLQSCRKG